MNNSINPIYLDYAATTPVDERVAEKMQQCLTLHGIFGNPASKTHQFGWQANEKVEQARLQAANLINADPKEIVFTSGATESNNLAIKGIAQFYQKKGKHIITSKTEHKAVLDTCQSLEKQGFSVTYLTPDKNGLIKLSDVETAIDDSTLLISIMHVNNETGVIQNIQALAELAKKHGVFFHTDAAQSVGKLPIDMQKTPVDLLSLSAHKIYGPKGIGALYVRRKPKVRLFEQINGGGHEQAMRSGTLATHQIVGLGEALNIATYNMQQEQRQIKTLSELFYQQLSLQLSVKRNGDNCLENILSLTFANIDNEALIVSCPELAFSAGSACTSATIEPSHVLQAMGINSQLANNTIRVSLGRFTTKENVETAVDIISHQVRRLQALSF